MMRTGDDAQRTGGARERVEIEGRLDEAQRRGRAVAMPAGIALVEVAVAADVEEVRPEQRGADVVDARIVEEGAQALALVDERDDAGVTGGAVDPEMPAGIEGTDELGLE